MYAKALKKARLTDVSRLCLPGRLMKDPKVKVTDSLFEDESGPFDVKSDLYTVHAMRRGCCTNQMRIQLAKAGFATEKE